MKLFLPRYCGTSLNCLGTNAITAIAASVPPVTPVIVAVIAAAALVGSPDGTVCTNMKPFRIGVHTDGVEYAHPITTSENIHPNNAGFNLNYFMKTSCIWYKTTV